MLSKRSFFILIGVLAILTLISYNFYLSTKRNAFTEVKRFNLIKSKIEYALYLKHLFKIPKINCSVKKENKIFFLCKNLDKRKFKLVEKKIFDNYVDIAYFHIISNGKRVTFKVGINK